MIYTVGSRGDGVRRLHERLELLGIPLRGHGASVFYTSDTHDLVTTLQRRYNMLVRADKLSGEPIGVDGIAGPETLAVIERLQASEQERSVFYDHRTLSRGDRGPEVEALQEQLIAAGYPIEADGKFGPKTEEAVKAFQRDHGLEPDGDWGRLSRGKMAEAHTDHQHNMQQGRPAPSRERPPVHSARAEGHGTTVQHVAYTPPVRSSGGYRMVSPVEGRSEIGDSFHSNRYRTNSNGERTRRDHAGFDVHALNEDGKRDRRNFDRIAIAALPGEVLVHARDAGSAGNMIVLLHQDRDGSFYTTTYMHLNNRDFNSVQKGDRVEQGQQIGRLGDTGNAKNDPDGNHIHFAVHRFDRRPPANWNHIRDHGRAVDLGPLNRWDDKTYDIVNGPAPAPAPRTRMATAEPDPPPRQLQPEQVALNVNFFDASPPVDFTSPLQPGLQGALTAVNRDSHLANALAQLGARIDGEALRTDAAHAVINRAPTPTNGIVG